MSSPSLVREFERLYPGVKVPAVCSHDRATYCFACEERLGTFCTPIGENDYCEACAEDVMAICMEDIFFYISEIFTEAAMASFFKKDAA